MSTRLEVIKQVRSNYKAIRAALPWLDCWVSPLESDKAQLPTAFKAPDTDYITAVPATDPAAAQAELVICLPGDAIPAGNGLLLIKSSDFDTDAIDKFASEHADRKVVIVTGYKKVMYFISQFRELMQKHANVYLSIANLCNLYAIERLVASGLADRLLYGSFMPFLEPDATMGPLVMSEIDWATKCDIAGNNLRRLLGKAPVYPAEVKYNRPAKGFAMDAHAHTIRPETPQKFEPPTGTNDWAMWKEYFDLVGCNQVIFIPSEANKFTEVASLEYLEEMIANANGRVKFMETFDPRGVEISFEHLNKCLGLDSFVGVKIHPATHQTPGSDMRYRELFKFASEHKLPIMTHSWAVSNYNPTQINACPEQFEEHFKAYMDVTFVLGHAGGRPESFDQTVRLCKTYPQVYVDVAGDYFNNGVTAGLLEYIGADRVLFASDAYWMDQRCEMGMFFMSKASDEDLEKMFYKNAVKVYSWDMVD